MNWALIIILAAIVFSFLLVLRSKKGKEMNLEQWSIGGRSFGSILVFVLIAGEAFTITTFLGSSGETYADGGAGLFVMVYGTLAYLISYFILPKIWRYANKNGLVSQADFFVNKFNSPYLGVFVSIVGVVAMIPYFTIQLNGLGIIIYTASYGAISSTLAMWIGAIIITLYVMISGIEGSAWTSFVKDILMIAIIVFLGVYFAIHYYGGVGSMFETIQSAKPGFLALPSEGQNVSWFITAVIVSAPGFYMWPHLFGATYSAKNEKVFKKNAIFMPLYQLMLLFIFFIGAAAILQIPNLSGNQVDLILLNLSKQTFDPWLVGLIGAAGFFAAIVPGSMILMSSSTLLSKNIFKVIKPSLSESRVTLTAKFLVPVIAVLALYLTLNGGDTIIELQVMGYSFVTQLFPTVFFSLSKYNFLTKQGAFSGIAAGASVVALTNLTGITIGSLFPFLPQIIKDFHIGIIALVVNILVLVIVSLATRVVSHEQIKRVGNEI